LTHPWIPLLVMLALGAAPGCRSSGTIADPLSRSVESLPEAGSLDASANLQRTLAAEAEDIQSGLAALRRSGSWRERGYFSASEHDAIEGLLFRFVVNHAAFWGELDRRGGPDLALVREHERSRAHALVLHAGLALADSSAFLVAEFMDDPVAIAKLNEAFYRSEIPGGTYDRLRLAVTSRDRQEFLAAAWHLHEQELHEPGSNLARLVAQDPTFARLLAELPGLHARATTRIRAVREHDARGPADLDESLRHSRAAALGRDATRDLGNASYAARALLFKDVSRIKSPTAHLIAFSADQKRRIHSVLRPGDLLLTYTAGYTSDVFIPGQFKHGITYVGDTEERAEAGLTASSMPESARPEAARFAANLARDTLPDGTRADLIEAVAEGVKFSNLDHILDTHINRLLVLRPRLSDAERVVFLAGIFAFVGDPYDFRFDFADASRQVCTEVIYRALDGKGGIRFELTTRGGHPTLSADDIVNYYFSTRRERFDLILYAEEDPDATDHRARIWAGEEGQRRLGKRMSSTHP